MNPLEHRYLVISAGGNLSMAVLGTLFAIAADSQAILLDALFDITYFVAALFTFKVARLVHREDDDRFPYGYAYFEPLVIGIKGLLVFGVSIMALAAAVETLFAGGRTISVGWAILYAVLATLGCVTVAIVIRSGARKSASPLLHADAENWVVNAAISACVLVAFASIFLLRDTAYESLIPYVDPAIVIAVVLISISIPVRMAWQAMMELLNRAPPEEITRQVRTILAMSTARLPVQEVFVRVIQPGRTRIVLAHVVLPDSYHIGTLEALDRVRADSVQRLQEAHLATILDLIFTSDRVWGAPEAIPVALK